MTGPQLPDYLQNRPFEGLNQRLSESLGAGAPPLLSIKGNRFTLVDVAGVEKACETFEAGLPYIDVCVVDALERESKIYFRDAYNPDNPGPPTCFSDNGIAPSKNASEPQSQTCPSCQWFVWGSAISKKDGKTKIKACGDYQKLAVLPVGIADINGVYLLRIPPNSLVNIREYTAWAKGHGVDLTDLVTRIKFVPDTLGTLSFKAVAFIDRDTALRRNEIALAKGTDALVGRTDQPIGTLPAPSAPLPIGQQPLPQPQAYQPAPFPVSAPAPTPSLPSAASPSTGTQPRGRGRPRKPGNGQPAQPTAQAEPRPVPFPTEGNAQFGIAQPKAPDEELKQNLDDFFGSSQS